MDAALRTLVESDVFIHSFIHHDDAYFNNGLAGVSSQADNELFVCR